MILRGGVKSPWRKVAHEIRSQWDIGEGAQFIAREGDAEGTEDDIEAVGMGEEDAV